MSSPMTREERLAKLRSDHEAGLLYPAGPDVDLLLDIIDADRTRIRTLETAASQARHEFWEHAGPWKDCGFVSCVQDRAALAEMDTKATG